MPETRWLLLSELRTQGRAENSRLKNQGCREWTRQPEFASAQGNAERKSRFSPAGLGAGAAVVALQGWPIIAALSARSVVVAAITRMIRCGAPQGRTLFVVFVVL